MGGERFAGLSVIGAREAVVDELEALGALRGSEPHIHAVPYSHRSGARVEPLISLQWFMRMDRLAAPAIDAVRDGRVSFHPDRWSRVYLDWMGAIRPWCISRQLWWGHRIPVYYCDACEETYVAREPPERCGACEGPLRQDEDVLDTWFSSALWPFATLGWPDATAALRAFYPTDVLVTARDIIFLWVARMIMMGIEFTGEIPFADVYVHSVIQGAPTGGGCRSRSAPASTRSWRSTAVAPTRCASACSRCPPRSRMSATATEEEVRQGEALAEQALQRRALRDPLAPPHVAEAGGGRRGAGSEPAWSKATLLGSCCG